VRAREPQRRLETVGAEQAGVRKILRGERDADGREQHGEAASAEFAREPRGLDDQQRRCQCRNEADRAQRIAEQRAFEKGHERSQRTG
jgi:hypothetical protein